MIKLFILCSVVIQLLGCGALAPKDIQTDFAIVKEIRADTTPQSDPIDPKEVRYRVILQLQGGGEYVFPSLLKEGLTIDGDRSIGRDPRTGAYSGVSILATLSNNVNKLTFTVGECYKIFYSLKDQPGYTILEKQTTSTCKLGKNL